MRRLARLCAIGAAAALALPAAAAAHHPDHGFGGEAFPGEGVSTGAHQHDGVEGHLPARSDNVRVVGKAEVTNPTPGQTNDGRVADVFHYKNYAYMTAFREPTCENAGVHVVDIKDVKNPFEVKDAFIPTSPASYAGEGIQVIRINNASFKGDVLIHQNETCPGQTPAFMSGGGISLWDVSNPLDAKPLALHAGDLTLPSLAPREFASQVHSMFAWTNAFDKKTYVVLVDDEELTDVDIMDISDPRNPVMVNDELDLVELFGVDQDEPTNLTSVFSHDMMVQKVGSRYVMNMNYWDGGYVLLDVTNPTPGNVTLISESDYAALDEERLARGHEISPEGNAHQSEVSVDAKYLIGTDEDFNPYRVLASITAGPFAGTPFVGASGSDTPPIDAATSIAGTPTFVGRACGVTEGATIPPAGPTGGIALVERGVCSFQEKFNTVEAAGYTSGVVMNSARADCEGLVSMLVGGPNPFVFVQRSTGFRILGIDPAAADPCVTAVPADAVANGVDIKAVFDGWGYVRLFKTDIPKRGGAGSITQLDTYAIPESQDPAFAEGFGDLSVHEVAIDPRERLAYFSYYSGGLRVAKYGSQGLTEVGAFIDEGGNNLWGVDILRRKGKTYVLASDRDFGLYIFQYTGRR
jgi:hypothetical protein